MTSDDRKMNFTLDGNESIAIVFGVKDRSVVKVCIELLIVNQRSDDVDYYTNSCVFKNSGCIISQVGYPDILRFSDKDMVESDYTTNKDEVLFHVRNITRQVLQIDAVISTSRFPRVLC